MVSSQQLYGLTVSPRVGKADRNYSVCMGIATLPGYSLLGSRFYSPNLKDVAGLPTRLVGRRGGLMVSALVVSGSSAPGLNPGRGHCLVFLGNKLFSHSTSLDPGV